MNIVKWYKNRNFQFKLVIGYLVLALIPMLCVTWYSYGKTRNVLLTEAYQSAEQEAERIEKNFSTMVEPYETILDVLYVDQMLSGYLFQDYSNDSYEDMFYYIDKKLSEICLMNAGIYKICFYSNNETLPQDNYYFYSMQDLVDQIINNWLHFTKRLLVKFHRAYKSNDRLLDLHLLHQNIYKFCLQVPALY